MRLKTNFIGVAVIAAAANCARAHGFGLSLGNDSQNTPIVIIPSSESTILDSTGAAVGPQNLFIASFSGTPAANGSYGVIHGFAYTTGAWPNYTATYNILSPLFFSDGTGTGPASTAPAGTYINIFDRDVGLYPGAAPGSVQVNGGGLFIPGYGVSLFDPHELQKQLFVPSGSAPPYGEYGFSYEVSVSLPGGQTLTTGPLVDVFATDIGDGGFYSTAPLSQQNSASLAIYRAAIAVPECWNYNGDGNYSDVAKWYQTVPNGMGFTAAFGDGVTTAINAPAMSVTIDRATFAGTLEFDSTTTSYTLASDAVAGHGLVLNNNGIGAEVKVLGGNHTISADLTLADSGGTTFSIAQGSSLTLSGAVTATGSSPIVALNGPGTLQVNSPPTLPANTAVLLNSGTLKFSANQGQASIGSDVTVTISSGATLELSGVVSALSTDVNIANDGSRASGGGLLVTGTNQLIGDIDGTGDLIVGPSGMLTADHIVQDAIVIGGTTSSHGLVTIDASDAAGNPLGQPSGLALAGSLTPSGPFGAGGIRSANLSSIAPDSADPAVVAMGKSLGSNNPAPVPEPSTLLLALLSVLGVVSTQFVRNRVRGQTV